MSTQDEFNFGGASSTDGYTRWQIERKQALTELARKLGLPLNHPVEVWLVGGIRLRGKLLLQEEKLFLDEDDARHLRLQVDHVAFSIREMESCVRLH